MNPWNTVHADMLSLPFLAGGSRFWDPSPVREMKSPVFHDYSRFLCFLRFSPTFDNKPRDKKNIHPVVINNHTIPYTEKYKYLGHIINNNLTDDDDIARQKRCIYAQANALARKFYLCNSSIKTTLFNSYCGSVVS